MLDRNLPDVATTQTQLQNISIDWVGMEKIDLAIKLLVGAEIFLIPAKADIFVNLHSEQGRGIHMSRMYLSLIQQLSHKNLQMPTVQGLLSTVLDSHKQQSEQARLILNFEFPMQKSSLSSGLQGHRNYPVQLQFDSTQANLVGLKFSIVYSSTCPASAALSRSANAELITENFKGKDWDLDQLNSWMQTSDSVAATPHAQRSLAEIELKVSDLEIGSFIDAFENCLGTPVQTAVKRMDELEFAKLNARNLMFCEDAIRKLADYCDKDQRIASYQITVNHQESLHAHNAVAKISKCK